jgi:hypothetical protein
MLVGGLLEFGLLIVGGLLLVLGLPFLIGHAIDQLATFVFGHGYRTRVGGVLHPVRQTVAAKTGEIHEIEVLDVGPLAQMLDQPPERSRLICTSPFDPRMNEGFWLTCVR